MPIHFRKLNIELTLKADHYLVMALKQPLAAKGCYSLMGMLPLYKQGKS